MTIRKIISLVLCLAICMSICANFSLVKAADSTDLLTFTLSSDGEYYLVGAKDTSITGEIVIPSTYDELPVKHISANGFEDCTGITKVTLPDTITRISTRAFRYATALEEINIPNGVKYIGENAFAYCVQLKEITIPDTVTHIGKGAFRYTSLENVVIPESVIYTDTNNTGGKNLFTAESLFDNCRSLKSVTLPSSITEIGQFAFDWCENLETLIIPEGVTKIWNNAFEGCSKYTNIYIPDSVKSMSVRAFGNMNTYHYKIASISFPAEISFIGDYPFGSLIKINHLFYRGTEEQFEEKFVIFDNITDFAEIAYETFHCNCTGEETYTYVNEQPGNCLGYGGKIYNCSICGEVLEDKYTALGDHVYDKNGACTVCGLGKTNFEDFLTFTLSDDGEYYLVGAKDTTITGEIVIPAHYNNLPVTQIAKDGFSGCKGITKVTLPETIVRIGSGSFYYATSLEEINIPDSVKYLGTSAFNGCEKLKSITIPDSVTHIGEAAFRCTGLESIVIPDSVIYEDIRNSNSTGTPFTAKRLFVSCESLKSVTLPSNIKTIGESAFSWCENLENFVIPESVTSIERDAFTACRKMLNIYIPDSVEHMSRFAFSTLTDYHHASISLPAGISLYDDSTTMWSLRINHVFYRGTEEQFAETIATIDNPETHSEDESKDFRYETVHFNCTGDETYTLTEDLAPHCLITGGKIYECSLCGTITDKIMSTTGPHIYAEDGSCTMCGLGKTNSADYLTFELALNEDGTTADYYIVSDCDLAASGAIIIPSEYEGLPVKVIGASAFGNCNQITSVIVPEGVEQILTRAFISCTSMKAIKLPSTIKYIGEKNVFTNTTALEGVFIEDLSAWCNIDFETSQCNPADTANNLYVYGELVEDLVIPEDVKTINKIAFQSIDSIKSVTFHDGIEEIGEYAFSYCQNLTEINIPDVPVKIRMEAFDGCAYYEDVNNWEDINGVEDETLYIGNHLIKGAAEAKVFTVKDGTITIADNAFYDVSNSVNTSLETLNLPDSLVRIGDYSFYGAFVLNVINFGSSLKYIGDHAFEGTHFLGELTLNEGLEYLGDYAFANSDLYKLHFPSTLTEFNTTAFLYTEYLEVITCSEENPAFLAEDNVLFTKDKYTLLLSSYRPGKEGTLTYYVPEETRVIEDYAFMLHPSRVSIKLHNNIERIGEDAFAGTYNTTKVDENYVGKYLVYAVNADFVVKEGTLGIADNCLHGVQNLTIPESVKFIGDSLEDVETIDVESIGSWFNMDLQHPDTGEVYLQNCITLKLNGVPFNELTSVEVPHGITTIEAYRFGDCSSLKKLIVPPTVTRIKDNAFYNFNKDLAVYCLANSAACYYAHANELWCHELNVVAKPGTTVDYTNFIIYTTMYNSSDVSDFVYLPLNKTPTALGSTIVNGNYLWGTGSTITYYEWYGREDFTVVVTGDVNGDSVCDVIDAVQTNRAINEQSELSGCYSLAADTNGDNEITVEDYSDIVNLALK